MPATDSAMGTPSGGSDSSSGTGGKIASGTVGPSILGLLVFGMMSILFGLSQLPGPWGHGFSTKTAESLTVFFWLPTGVVTTSLGLLGALVLALVGFICLWRGVDTYWGTAFLGYGGFWIAWATIVPNMANHTAYGYGTAGFLFVWLLFTLTFLITSMKHGWMTFFLFVFLFISVILLVVEFWTFGANGTTTTISGFELGAIGGLWIFTGFLGWYLGTARLAEITYGKKILPS